MVWVLVALALAGIGFFAYQDAEREKARVAFCGAVEDEVNRAGALVFEDADAALAGAEAALGRLQSESEFKCKANLAERASSIAVRARVQPLCTSANDSLTAIRVYVEGRDFSRGLQEIKAFDSGYPNLVGEKAHCLDDVNDELRHTKQRVIVSLRDFLNGSAVLDKQIDFDPVDGIVAAWGDEDIISHWGSWRRLLDSGRAVPVVVDYADWPGAAGPLIQAPKEAKLRKADRRQIASQVRRLLGVPFVLYGKKAEERIRENADALILEVNAKWKSYGGGGPWNTSVATELRLIARYGGRRLGSATITDDVPETFEIKTRYGIAPQAMIRDAEIKFWRLLEDLDRQGAFDTLKARV